MSLEDKTEAPTPRKRTESREEGQVARSIELNSALILLSGLYLIKTTGPGLAEKLQAILIDTFTHFPKHDLVTGDISNKLVQLLLSIGMAILPLLIGIAVVGFAASALQVGLVFSMKPLQFKGSKLNPLPGFQRMFSTRALVELGKSVAKISVVGYIVYTYLKQHYPEVAMLAGANYSSTCSLIGQLAWGLLTRASGALFIIAALDYMYQRHSHEKGIKMTKQEVKDDSKRSEGDPLIKGKIKQRQREMAMKRMMTEVPKADVVITNPTHFAVALKYDQETMDSPTVIAKGQRLVAQRIKEIAIENNIPIVENVQLARTLFASVEIGNPIPADLYQAVAEILAYVYRLSKKLVAA